MDDLSRLPPGPSWRDLPQDALVVALTPVPFVPQILEKLLQYRYQKRVHDWAESVVQELQALRVNIEYLADDETFLSVWIQAQRAVLATHQEQKIVALRNAVVNAARGKAISGDLQLLFIRYIDELSPVHLGLLQFLVQHIEEIKNLASYELLYAAFTAEHGDATDRDAFLMLCGDLQIRGLVRISQDMEGFGDLYQSSKLLLETENSPEENYPRIRLTRIGEGFISFVLS